MEGIMKKLIFLVLVPFLMYGQITTSYELHGTDGLELYFVGTGIDSATNASTAFSNIFADWEEYNLDWATYDIGYEYELDSLTAGGEIVGIIIEGQSNVGTWNDVDTLLAIDTLNTSHAGLTGYGLTQLNQDDICSFPDYRVTFDAASSDSTGNTFTSKLSLFLRKKN
jgi:hypothetical protein